jgi:hypothetical protein
MSPAALLADSDALRDGGVPVLAPSTTMRLVGMLGSALKSPCLARITHTT